MSWAAKGRLFLGLCSNKESRKTGLQLKRKEFGRGRLIRAAKNVNFFLMYFEQPGRIYFLDACCGLGGGGENALQWVNTDKYKY